MTEYVFEGEVIKLSARDFYKWQDMYQSLDLTAELIQIDEEFSIRLREGEKMKKWFSECYARLNGRNKIAERSRPISRGNYIDRPLTTRERFLEQDLTDRGWADGLSVYGVSLQSRAVGKKGFD